MKTSKVKTQTCHNGYYWSKQSPAELGLKTFAFTLRNHHIYGFLLRRQCRTFASELEPVDDVTSRSESKSA